MNNIILLRRRWEWKNVRDFERLGVDAGTRRQYRKAILNSVFQDYLILLNKRYRKKYHRNITYMFIFKESLAQKMISHFIKKSLNKDKICILLLLWLVITTSYNLKLHWGLHSLIGFQSVCLFSFFKLFKSIYWGF